MLMMEKILFLRGVSIFRNLKMAELAWIAEFVSEESEPSGSVLFREGDLAESLYIVVSGQVEVVRKNDRGERIVAVLGEKECVGEMSILDDEPRSATIRVMEDSFFLRIKSEDFKDLIHDNPDIAFGIFRMFTGRIRKNQPESETATVIPQAGM
jgi:CRP-like cAMP-binding protein